LLLGEAKEPSRGVEGRLEGRRRKPMLRDGRERGFVEGGWCEAKKRMEREFKRGVEVRSQGGRRDDKQSKLSAGRSLMEDCVLDIGLEGEVGLATDAVDAGEKELPKGDIIGPLFGSEVVKQGEDFLGTKAAQIVGEASEEAKDQRVDGNGCVRGLVSGLSEVKIEKYREGAVFGEGDFLFSLEEQQLLFDPSEREKVDVLG